jgi:hypothetical protein
MPRKTTKFIEPINDTLENVAKCVIKSKEPAENKKNDGELRISEITIKLRSSSYSIRPYANF